MPKKHFVAETDGDNAIVAVWFKPNGKNVPRPFDFNKDHFDPFEKAKFSGATEAEIKRWLVARSKALAK